VQPASVASHSLVAQGSELLDHQLVHIPSTVSGLSSIPLTPDGMQCGFMTEARGTALASEAASVAPGVTGVSTTSSGRLSRVCDESAESKSKPVFILDKFNGETSLDTFLWRFNQLADHMEWGEKDKFINLCSSLEGPAGQVLRELPKKGTATDLEE